MIAPLALGLGASLCFLVALAGLRLVRDPGPVARAAPPAAVGASERQGPLRGVLDAVGARLSPLVMSTLDGARRARVRGRLDAAGRPDGITTVEVYARRKGTWTGLLGIAGLVLCLQGRLVIGLPLIVVGWFWVDLWIWRAARVRQAAIERDLPDFLDVLAVCVNAGIAFRPALARVADAQGGPLGEEVVTTLRQLSLGATRRGAFEALRERNRSEPLGQFVSALLQAEELGVPISEALVELARDQRRSSHQSARRRAQQAAPRVTLVVTTLMVPATMLLIIAALVIGSNFSVGSVLGG